MEASLQEFDPSKEFTKLTTHRLVHFAKPEEILSEGSFAECEKEKNTNYLHLAEYMNIQKMDMDVIKNHPNNVKFFENNKILTGSDLFIGTFVKDALNIIESRINGSQFKKLNQFEWSKEARFIIDHNIDKWRNEILKLGTNFLNAVKNKDLLVHEQDNESSLCYMNDEGLISFFLERETVYEGRQRFAFVQDIHLFRDKIVSAIIYNFEHEVLGLSTENETILNIFLGLE